ncbi:MAG: hypothetical protein JRJ87_07855 [Deltaproteobacteria bacterium]|nr:hypothetical protein [Deltaproteobacteria bacterium]
MKKNNIVIILGFVSVALGALVSCVTKTKTIKDQLPAKEIFLDPLHIGIKPDKELGLIDFDAATLFKEGVRLQQAGQSDRAFLFFERIITEFNSSRYLSAAAFNAGNSLEDLERVSEAVERYRIITRKLSESKDWLDAAFRESMCLARLEKHAAAVELLKRLLDRKDLSVSDRIDALVLLGEALKAEGELIKAESKLRAALRLYRAREREEFLDPAPAARAEYRLSEMAEKRFIDAPLRLPEEQMRLDLEAKATRLLEAQAGFLRTIRYGNPEWASAAGYQVGTLYLHLHQAMQQAPVPDDLDPQEIEVYKDLLKERTAVLLRKALKVFEMTLELAERTMSDNHWTKAAREEMSRVESRVLSLYETLPNEEP